MFEWLGLASGDPRPLAAYVAVVSLSVVKALMSMVHLGLAADISRTKESLIRNMEAEADVRTAESQQAFPGKRRPRGRLCALRPVTRFVPVMCRSGFDSRRFSQPRAPRFQSVVHIYRFHSDFSTLRTSTYRDGNSFTFQATFGPWG